MTALRYIEGEALRAALPMAAAIEVLEETFGRTTLPMTPQRTVLEHGDGQLLLMPSWGAETAGVKLVTVKESNPAHGLPLINGAYVLFSGETLEPVAIFDAAPLTALRTAAVSALATKHLARPDARHLVIFGAGVQSAAHAEAIQAVRDIDAVTIVSRSSSHAGALVETLNSGSPSARVGTPEAVKDADILCTCTTATTALFPGTNLPLGCHVNGVGSHRPDARELDSDAISRSTVVVELGEAALTEAGDLLLPIEEGVITPGHIVGDLRDVVAGRLRRRSADEITLFKSVGVAFEDLAVATAAAKVLVEGLRPR